MKWNRVSDYCIASGPYRISKYTMGDRTLYQIYHGETLIGEARDGNAARKVAMQHKTHNKQKSPAAAIGGDE